MENSERDGNTRPPDLPLEKPIGRSGSIPVFLGFHSVSDGKKICLQVRSPRFVPWVGRIPWRRKQPPTPVFWSGEFHGERSLAGYSPWDCKELATTERPSLSHLPWQSNRSIPERVCTPWLTQYCQSLECPVLLLSIWEKFCTIKIKNVHAQDPPSL